jgi:hypothetical protein
MSLEMGIERRTSTRQAFQCEAMYRTDEQIGTATICDVSPTGVGLMLPRRVGPGEHLTVELPDWTRTFWRLKILHVVHVTPRGSDQWLVGCTFAKHLSDQDLQHMLA